jgi:hypothetical protein
MILTDWINKTSMTSLGGLVLQVVWFIGSIGLTISCINLFATDPGDYFEKVPMATDPEKLKDFMALYLAMADSNVKTAHNTALILAGTLVAAWTGIKAINKSQHGKDRDTSKEKMAGEAQKIEAEAHGKETARIEAANGNTTQERAALQPSEDGEQEPQWTSGDPKGGIL